MSALRPDGLGYRAAYATIATGIEKAVALGIALYLPRHLPLPDYGRYALIISYLGLFQALPDASLETMLVTRLAGGGPDVASRAGQGALVRLAVSLVGATLGLTSLALATGDAKLSAAAAVWATGLVATAASPYRALLRAELRIERYLALVAIQSAIAVVLLGIVVRAEGGLVPVLASVAAPAVCAIGAGRLLVGRGARLAVHRGLARTLLGGAWPLAAGALALVGAQQVVALVLFRLHGPAVVGLLGGAQKLIEATSLLPRALTVVLLPLLAASAGVSANAQERTARDAVRVLMLVLAPVAAVLVSWPDTVMVTILGPPFAAAGPALRILGMAVLLGGSGAVLANLLVATGAQRTLLASMGLSAIVLAVVGLLLVPGLGLTGAAVATVAGMTTGQAVLCTWPRMRVPITTVLAAAARPLALAAAATAIVAALGADPLVGAPLLIVAYAAGVVATGTARRPDTVV